MLPMIAILSLFIGFGAIVGLIVLLVNPRTRPVGLGILAAGLLLVLLAGLGWFAAGSPSDRAAQFRDAELGRSFTPADDIENSPPVTRPATRPRVTPVPRVAPVPRVPAVPVVPPVAADLPPAAGVADAPPLPHARITVAWGVLLGIAVALGGLAALLRNPRTRPVGVGLVVVLVLSLPVALFLKLVHVRSTPPMPSDMAGAQPWPPGVAASSRPVPVPPAAIGSPREQESAAAKPAPHGGVLSAIGHALAGVVPHNGKPSKAEVAGSSKPSPPAAAKAAPPAAGRPAWVDAPPRYVDNAYLVPIAAGPYTTQQECEADMPAALEAALDKYIEQYVGPEAARRVRLPDSGYDLRRQLVRQEWVETVQTSLGEMVVLHAQLEVDRKVQDRIRDALRQATAAGRLWVAAAGLGGVLALLGVLFGYLKLTENGSRRRRIQAQLAVLVVVAVAAGLVAARMAAR